MRFYYNPTNPFIFMYAITRKNLTGLHDEISIEIKKVLLRFVDEGKIKIIDDDEVKPRARPKSTKTPAEKELDRKSKNITIKKPVSDIFRKNRKKI
ncbi:MAG: hypothetical protein Q8T08_11010 [Ignavibacteria bacterium]|nr:hypothetical protein [Ignavibacteria bacterium]